MSRSEILRNVPYKMTAQDVEGRVMEHLAKLPYLMWENQFNLFDSHDVSRLHNNPKVHPDEYRGAILFIFTLVGAASIYYGDEAGIDGIPGSNEGCRYPMPWSRDYKDSEVYQMYRTMAHMKAQHKALSHGGMKFLYAEGYVVAVARFCEDEVFVSVISASEKTEKIRLALGAVGAASPKGGEDAFGKKLEYRQMDQHSIELTVEAHQSYFIECEMCEEGSILLSKTFRHRTLEERAEEYGGQLNLDGEYEWGEPVGREVW